LRNSQPNCFFYQISIDRDQNDALICEACSVKLDVAFEMRENARKLETNFFAETRKQKLKSGTKQESSHNNRSSLSPIPIDETGIEQAAIEYIEDPSAAENAEVKLRKRGRTMEAEPSDSEEEPAVEQSKKLKRSKPPTKKITKIGVKKAAVLQHQCPICSKVLSRKEHLKRHIESVHEKKKNFTCSRCSKAYSRKDLLENHKCAAGSSSTASRSGKQKAEKGKASKNAVEASGSGETEDESNEDQDE
jgi:uncharacterized Zn-finger protein